MNGSRRHRWVAGLAVAWLAGALPAAAGDDYQALLDRIETQRRVLHRRWQEAPDAGARRTSLEEARGYLLAVIADQLIPPWVGTPWAYTGTAERPQEGAIACGFFVGTILAHAGFRLDRIGFGVLPAQTAIERLCPPRAIAIFSNRSTAAVLAHLERSPDGLYLVGLDYHIGLVVKRGSDLQFCHSTVLGPTAVLCEPAAGDNPLTASGYVVIGALLTDQRVEAWLAGQPIALTGRRRAGADPAPDDRPAFPAVPEGDINEAGAHLR